MASIGKKVLMEATALTAASTTTTKLSVDQKWKSLFGWIKASSVNAATTVNAKIQHSPNGTDWTDWVTFTAIAGVSGFEIKYPTTNIIAPNIQAVVTLSGVTKAATVLIELYYDPDK